MWSHGLALELGGEGPAVIAVNPGSPLGCKMVKEGGSVAGKDLQIGAGILARAVLDDEFTGATGQYVDNDVGRFAACQCARRATVSRTHGGDRSPAGCVAGTSAALGGGSSVDTIHWMLLSRLNVASPVLHHCSSLLE